MKEKFESLPKDRQKHIKNLARKYRKDYETLQDFRKSLGITQKMVAESQGISQVNISNLEKRDDMHISTLKKYVEALGCQLEINIIVPDESIATIENLV